MSYQMTLQKQAGYFFASRKIYLFNKQCMEHMRSCHAINSVTILSLMYEMMCAFRMNSILQQTGMLNSERNAKRNKNNDAK